VSDDPLLALADELYAGPATAFTAARDAAAKAAPDKALAARVKALKKPSVAAWAVNLLVRREAEQIDQVLTMGESLRQAAASLDGEELRALTRQRRQLTTALASSARSLAREHDVKLTPATVDQVEGVLNAAMLDPVAADVVRSGLLVAAFTSTGVSEVDVAAVVAVPEALGVRATPTAARRPELHVVVPDDAVRREAAQDRVDEAAAVVARAQAALAEVDTAVEALNARRLQLQGEIDEIRRRLAGLEDDVDGVDQELEEADEARDEAVEDLERAKDDHATAVDDRDALD
jgi:septal ring factor EnvC (AmiA/AmiB activator)